MVTEVSALPRLWNSAFKGYFGVQFLGAFNDNFYKNTVLISLIYRDGSLWGISSSQWVAIAGGIFILPFFIVSATAGVIADHWEKSRWIRRLKLLELALMGLAFWGWALGSYPILMGVIFLMGLQSALFGPVKYSLIPEIVAPEHLLMANAWVDSATYLAILLGSLLGTQVIEWLSWPYWSAMAIIFAVLGVFASWRIPKGVSDQAVPSWAWNLCRSTKDSLRALHSSPSLLKTAIRISFFWFVGISLLSMIPPYIKEVWGGGPSLITLMLMVFSVGIGLGSFLCVWLRRRLEWHSVIQIGVLIMFLASLLFYLLPLPPKAPALLEVIEFLGIGLAWQSVTVLMLLAVGAGIFVVPLYTRLLSESEKSSRSRVIAANNIYNAGWMVVASGLLSFLLGQGVPFQPMILGLGLLSLLFLKRF